jgi:prepilin-type N-terminal cleavage/methylation domain-containing protein
MRMPYVMQREQRGFTLLELLVGCGIIAVLVTSIVAAFAGGIRVWERARAMGGAPQAMTLCLERMERDLRNAFDSRDIPFRGEETSVTFPGLIRVTSKEGSTYERLATVRYAASEAQRVLARTAWAFPDPEPRDDQGTDAVAAEETRFAYSSGRENGARVWEGTWLDKTNRPQGVRVSLIMRTGGQRVEVQRTIVLPSA